MKISRERVFMIRGKAKLTINIAFAQNKSTIVLL